MNGGKLNTTNTAITSSGDKILLNGSEVIQEVQYGKQTGSTGISNYNNSGYIKVEKNKYKVNKGYEWNTKADGSGTSYDQDKVYSASDFCDASNGDCEVILYVNWKKICTNIKLHKNDGSDSTYGPYTVCLTDAKRTLGYKADGTYRYSCSYGTKQFGCWNTIKTGQSLLGWSTNKNATSASYANSDIKYRGYWNITDTFIKNNDGKTVNLYGIYHNTRVYLFFTTGGGTLRKETTWPTDMTHADGSPDPDAGKTKYWRTTTLTIDGKSYSNVVQMGYSTSSYSTFKYTMFYSDSAHAYGDGLPDVQNPNNLYVSKTGYKPANGKEWKCISPSCNGTTYNETSDTYASQSFCSSSYFDCNAVVSVNWVKK